VKKVKSKKVKKQKKASRLTALVFSFVFDL